ncbi:RAxF-45 family protein [Pontibacillus salicampi]|uniref:RAxF-45 family protein n=1 Tax=Pontibacillus salicampi TaxID=1449801 RepID=A0ABV6LMU0_9BACI
MLHMEMHMIDRQSLYVNRVQTHDFVADGTRMSFFQQLNQ